MEKNKNEHIIFQDIPSGRSNGKFHSAILTTYAIDLINFDSHLRNVLHRKQICSINVFADKDQLDKSIDFVSPLFLSNIGKDYCITSVQSKGAFHPKINFFVGDSAVLVILGSGNLTVTGHGKNHETFTGFMIDESDDTQRPLVEECWRYIINLANKCGEFEKRRIVQEIPDNCSFLDSKYKISPHQLCNIDDDMQAALLYNDHNSGVLEQIAKIIPLKSINKVTIASPFFDEDGETISTIASLCTESEIEVLIQESCSLPPYKMKNNPRVHFFDFDATKRGKCMFKNNYKRLAHTKLFIFASDECQYCIIGSANATKAGLGTIKARGINDEFCVLYRSYSKDFLNILGLKTKKKCSFNPKGMTSRKNTPTENDYLPIEILSASYQSGIIQIEIGKTSSLPSDYCVYLDNGLSTSYYSNLKFRNDSITFDIDLSKHTYVCGIADGSHKLLSNKIFINKLDQLKATNPSKSSRTLNRFISKIENEGYDGLEIADMLTDIIWEFVDNEDIHVTKSYKTSNRKPQEESLPDISYHAEYDNDDVHSSSYTKGDSVSCLVECIEESNRKKLRSMDEDIKDEEEAGKSETSNVRTHNYTSLVQVEEEHIKSFSKQAASVLTSYSCLVQKRANICDEKAGKGLIKDDFNFFSLSMFAATELCYLNRLLYDFSEYSRFERSEYQKELYDSLNWCMDKYGSDALYKFASLCKQNPKFNKEDKDFMSKAQRAIKYAILYTMFFERYSPNRNLYKKTIYESTRSLISQFGKPDMESLTRDLLPIIERYNHIFEMYYIEKTIKDLEQ